MRSSTCGIVTRFSRHVYSAGMEVVEQRHEPVQCKGKSGLRGFLSLVLFPEINQFIPLIDRQ